MILFCMMSGVAVEVLVQLSSVAIVDLVAASDCVGVVIAVHAFIVVVDVVIDFF